MAPRTDSSTGGPATGRSPGSPPWRDGCRVPLPWSGGAPPFGSGSDAAAPDVLSYRRGGVLTVVVNLSAHPVELPAHSELLISSGQLRDGLLPPDAAVWLRD